MRTEVCAVVMSGPGAGWDAPPPAPTRDECDQAAFVVGRHADDEQTGVCPVCGVSRCQIRRDAQALVLIGVRAGVIIPDEVGDAWDGSPLGGGDRGGVMGGRRDGPPCSYSPAVLAADVMFVLAQRGLNARLRAVDIAQLHQAAWTLLTMLGIAPDTEQCACLACGGTALALADVTLVTADEEPGTPDGSRDQS
jgi:hypothetical protein